MSAAATQGAQTRPVPAGKVLHIGPTPFFSDRGCHIRIRGLVLALQRAGVSCVLCTYHHGEDVDGVVTERTRRLPGYTKEGAGPSGFKYLADILLLAKVCSAIRRHRPAVLHGHLHEGALIGHVARRIFFWRRIPLVFDMQGSLVGELEQYGYFQRLGLLRKLFEWAERFIDRVPDRIAASSRASLDIAQNRFRVPRGRLTLVPDGADFADPEQHRVRSLRSELSLPRDRAVVMYTGSLLPVKGVHELHVVIRSTASAGLPVHFLLVGYPTDHTQEYLREHGLQSLVTLTGRVPFASIGEYLALGDIALEPKAGAAGEASGKLLNYMAAGLPVVCFDTANNREMVGENGCYASLGSVDGLVEEIGRLAALADRGRALGLSSRDRAVTEFSWDTSAARLCSIYGELLASRQRPVRGDTGVERT